MTKPKIKLRKHKVLCGADFSAQEPRVMSSLCGERELIDGYNLRTSEFPKGKDFYAMLASSAFGKDYWECTEFDQNGKFQQDGKNRRQAGKVIQLGVSYGMGVKLLVEGINAKKAPDEEKMTIEQGEKMMSDFFGKFKSLAAWKEYNAERLEVFGYMETAGGRRRRLYDTWLPDYDVKALKYDKVEDIFFNLGTVLKVVDEKRTKEIGDKLSSFDNNFKRRDYIEDLKFDPMNKIRSNSGYKSKPKTQATNFCLAGDTKVITREGVREIQQLNGPVEVWDGEKFTTGTVVKTGMRPHYRVNFYDGTCIDCSPEHPFCKITGNGNVFWEEAGDLHQHDGIKLSGEAEFNSPLKPFETSSLEGASYNRKDLSFNSMLDRPYELGLLLGRMASDGSFSPGSNHSAIKWLVAEHEYSILPELEWALTQGGFTYFKKVKDRSKSGRKEMVWLVIHSKSLKEELVKMGIKNQIPKNLWDNKEALRGFLRGMFDGDGGVNLSSVNRKGNLNLTFGRGNFEKYANDISIALSAFGIRSRVHCYSHRINVTIEKRDIGEFVEKIGFMNPDKNEKALNLFKTCTKKNFLGNKLSRVKEVIDCNEEILMYDIVNTGSGYFCSNKVIVHNCIQGTAAELTKRAMVAIYNHPDKERLKIGILAPVHDEIIIEGDMEHREEVLKVLTTCMSNSAKGVCEVSMICDGVTETRWNLEHFTDKIKKEYKKNPDIQQLISKYPEISPDFLQKVVEDEVEVETDYLVPN